MWGRYGVAEGHGGPAPPPDPYAALGSAVRLVPVLSSTAQRSPVQPSARPTAPHRGLHTDPGLP